MRDVGRARADENGANPCPLIGRLNAVLSRQRVPASDHLRVARANGVAIVCSTRVCGLVARATETDRARTITADDHFCQRDEEKRTNSDPHRRVPLREAKRSTRRLFFPSGMITASGIAISLLAKAVQS
jgi:hypothetical protein